LDWYFEVTEQILAASTDEDVVMTLIKTDGLACRRGRHRGRGRIPGNTARARRRLERGAEGAL